MAQRGRKIGTRKFLSLPLTNLAAATKGYTAFLNPLTGLYASVAAAGLIPVGYFCDDAVGDGATKVKVELWDEIITHKFPNDGTHPVVAADRGKVCWFKDGATVSGDPDTGRPVAGVVVDVESNGIRVIPSGLAAAVQSPAGVARITSVDHADTTPVTLLPAADYPRVVLVHALCTESLAGTNDPTFAVGTAGTVDLVVTTAVTAANGTAGDSFTRSAVLPAGQALIATLTDGGDATGDAGAFDYAVLAMPSV